MITQIVWFHPEFLYNRTALYYQLAAKPSLGAKLILRNVSRPSNLNRIGEPRQTSWQEDVSLAETRWTLAIMHTCSTEDYMSQPDTRWSLSLNQ